VRGLAQVTRRARPQQRRQGTAILLFAFAFAVIADPVSSVAYAIEAALRALDGRLALLVPTMALVIAIIAVVAINFLETKKGASASSN
jgi:hypothetical protein